MDFYRTDHTITNVFLRIAPSFIPNKATLFSAIIFLFTRHSFQHYGIATYRVHLALAHIYSTILEHLQDLDHAVHSVQH